MLTNGTLIHQSCNLFLQGENRGGPKIDEKERGFKSKEETEESYLEEHGGGDKESSKPVEGAAVVLQAIGETIVEIGKTTTELVAGRPRDEPVEVIEEESTTTTMKKT